MNLNKSQDEELYQEFLTLTGLNIRNEFIIDDKDSIEEILIAEQNGLHSNNFKTYRSGQTEQLVYKKTLNRSIKNQRFEQTTNSRSQSAYHNNFNQLNPLKNLNKNSIQLTSPRSNQLTSSRILNTTINNINENSNNLIHSRKSFRRKSLFDEISSPHSNDSPHLIQNKQIKNNNTKNKIQFKLDSSLELNPPWNSSIRINDSQEKIKLQNFKYDISSSSENIKNRKIARQKRDKPWKSLTVTKKQNKSWKNFLPQIEINNIINQKIDILSELIEET